ncbi:MAG: hypothetical protein H6709_24895 [Kofleriaceae bacterium]|nr:hypothetical protein [Myxococcales bacterium]MCB9560824.1 hypothetical protein [Kofleriaceae bacterium]MCB9575327.1 hypothetical protein [Kofleriaceae bacterium]
MTPPRTLRRAAVPVGLAIASVLAAGCGDDGGGGGGGAIGPFAPSVDTVRIEIDYETGEAPYTGSVLGFGDTFDLTIANLDRLFAGTRTVEVPTTIAAMEDIGAVADEELTTADLLALADAHRGVTDGGGVKSYYVVFVSGTFADADGAQPSVLGVSIGDTGVIAMFKDVIASTGSTAFPNLARFVEQSTLIHELGHGFGLVDNGVATTSAHVDTAHGKHCTNDACVMYWLNEGASDAAMFARQYVTSGNAILFGDECLADVDALTGGP